MRWVLVVATLGIVAVACEAQLDPSLTELEVGDCVRDPGTVNEVQGMDTVDCSEPDALRVAKKFEITGFDSYPGDSQVEAIAMEGCAPASLWLFPTEQSWNEADDREVLCFQ